MLIILHQIENIDKEIKIIFKNQVETLELKNTIIKIKRKSQEYHHSRFELAEENN